MHGKLHTSKCDNKKRPRGGQRRHTWAAQYGVDAPPPLSPHVKARADQRLDPRGL